MYFTQNGNFEWLFAMTVAFERSQTRTSPSQQPFSSTNPSLIASLLTAPIRVQLYHYSNLLTAPIRVKLHYYSNLLAAPIQVQLHFKPRFHKRKRLLKEISIERERQREVRRMQEERRWESSEEEDITAIRWYRGMQTWCLMSLIDCFSVLSLSFRAAGLVMAWNREVGVRISFCSSLGLDLAR